MLHKDVENKIFTSNSGKRQLFKNNAIKVT